MYARLADGALIDVRPIRPDDKRALSLGLNRLSERSIQRRFLTAKPRFSQAELRYLTELDGRDHVALVASLADRRGNRMLGVARFVRLDHRPEVAEAAIVVVDAWQGRGVGSLLGVRLAEAARARRIKRFSATILSDNVPALRLMQKLSDRLERDSGRSSVSELVADLAA